MVSAKSNSKSKVQPLNVMTGTDSDDLFKGAGKKEVFYGLAGSDTVSYENATSGVIADLGRASNNKGVASGNTYFQIENLIGSSFNDKLHGNSAKNTLDGGRGKDILSGKDGDDLYLVDITSNGRMEDTIIEDANKGSGIDTIKLRGAYNGSATSLTLNPNIENLDASKVTGQGLLNLIGNAKGNTLEGNGAANVIKGLSGNDLLRGNDGNDILWGGDGNDRLVGGVGNDALWGGKGKDIFVFSAQLNADTNIDVIKDFEVKSDLIHLDSLIFTKLSTVGALNAAQFVTSETITVPEDQDNYIYYDTKTGGLFYDEDGSGSGAMVQFATIANKAAITYEDIKIV